MNDPLIEILKVFILLLMFAVAITSIGLSVRLRRHTNPLERQLQKLHRTDLPTDRLEPLLRDVEARYIALLKHVDQVDTAEFSAGCSGMVAPIPAAWRRSLGPMQRPPGSPAWLPSA